MVCRQRPGTAKGITFLLLEDERGLVNVIIFPALYEEQRLLVRAEPFLVVEGRLQSRHGTLNVIATRLHTLEMVRQAFINAPARDFLIGSRPLHPPAKIEERKSLREIAPDSYDLRSPDANGSASSTHRPVSTTKRNRLDRRSAGSATGSRRTRRSSVSSYVFAARTVAYRHPTRDVPTCHAANEPKPASSFERGGRLPEAETLAPSASRRNAKGWTRGSSPSL